MKKKLLFGLCLCAVVVVAQRITEWPNTTAAPEDYDLLLIDTGQPGQRRTKNIRYDDLLAPVRAPVGGITNAQILLWGTTNSFLPNGKYIAAGPNTTITTNGSTIVISSTGGGAATSTNIPVVNTVWVDSSNGSDSTGLRGNMALPFQTIAAGLAVVQSGDTLIVRGDHTVSPNYSQNTSSPNYGAALRLQNKTNVTVVGDGARVTANADGNIWMLQNVTNVDFFGFEIVGNGENHTNNVFGAVLLDGTNKWVNIRHNRIRKSGNHGVVTLRNQHASDYVTVAYNEFETGGTHAVPTLSYDGTAIATGGRNWNIVGNTIRDWYRGIEFFSDGTNEVSGHLVSGNIIESSWEEGILSVVAAFHDNVISGNMIRGSRDTIKTNIPGEIGGIKLQAGSNNVISMNYVVDMANINRDAAFAAVGGHGIRISSEAGEARGNQVVGNRVDGIRYRGIEVVGPGTYANIDTLVSANQVRAAQATGGIWLYGTSNAVVQGNYVNGSPTGVYVELSTNAAVMGNSLRDNGSFGLVVESTAVRTLVFGNDLYNNVGSPSNAQMTNASSTTQLGWGDVRYRYGVFNGVNVDNVTLGWTNGLGDSHIQMHNALTTNLTGNPLQYGHDWRIFSSVAGPASWGIFDKTSNRYSLWAEGLYGRTAVGDLIPGVFSPAAQLNVFVNTNAALTRERHFMLSGRDYFRGTNTYSIGSQNSGISFLLYSQGNNTKSLFIQDTDYDTDTNNTTSVGMMFKPYVGELSFRYMNSNTAPVTIRSSQFTFPDITADRMLYLNGSGVLSPVTAGANITFSGGTLSASAGGAGSLYLNGSNIVNPNFTNSSKSVFSVANGTNISITATNIATAEFSDDAVTDAKLRNSAGLSVIGRSANSTGDPADITAASDGQVLRRSGTSIGFGAVDLASANAVTGVLPTGNLPGSVVLDADLNTNQFDTNNATYPIGIKTLSKQTNVLHTAAWQTFNTNINWDLGSKFVTTLTNNLAMTFSSAADGRRIEIWTINDATGGWTLQWPTNVWFFNPTNGMTTNAVGINTNANGHNLFIVDNHGGTNRVEGPFRNPDHTNIVDITRTPFVANGFLGWATNASGVGYLTNRTRIGLIRSFDIPMAGWYTNGVATSLASRTTWTNVTESVEFVDGATNTARIMFALPVEWGAGTVRVRFEMGSSLTNNTSNTNVVFSLKAGAVGNGETWTNITFGTAVTVTNHIHKSPYRTVTCVTPDLTVGNTPAANKPIVWELTRLNADATDVNTNTIAVVNAQVFFTEASTEPTLPAVTN